MRYLLLQVDVQPVMAALCVQQQVSGPIVALWVDLDPLSFQPALGRSLDRHTPAAQGEPCVICNSRCTRTPVGDLAHALQLTTAQGISAAGDPADAYGYLESLA